MSKKGSNIKQGSAQIAELAEKYFDIKKNTEAEIAKIKQQLLDIGVSGSTVVKMKPIWNHELNLLLRKESENLDEKHAKKAS